MPNARDSCFKHFQQVDAVAAVFLWGCMVVSLPLFVAACTLTEAQRSTASLTNQPPHPRQKQSTAAALAKAAGLVE